MWILKFSPKMSLVFIFGFFVMNSFTQAQNNREWNLGIGFGIERAKSDLEGCDSCFRYGYSLDGGQTFTEVYPKAEGFYGVNFSFTASKKISKYFSFFTGLQYIPLRKIGFSNFPLIANNTWVLGKQNYIWRNEVEIPALLRLHLPFFKERLEISPAAGINFGLSRKYFIESNSNFGKEIWFIRHEKNFFQRINPVFDIRIIYNPNATASFSVSYFTQALLPFIAGYIEESVFTSGCRVGYQRSISSIFTQRPKK
jgi:hypothetical protein